MLKPDVPPNALQASLADAYAQPVSSARDSVGEDAAGSDYGRLELTERQREVLRLLAEGCSMKEAGIILKITPRTVAFHKYRMMAQLGITSSARLIRYAVRHQVV